MFDVDGTSDTTAYVTLLIDTDDEDNDDESSKIEAFVPPGLRTAGKVGARVRFSANGAVVEGWTT